MLHPGEGSFPPQSEGGPRSPRGPHTAAGAPWVLFLRAGRLPCSPATVGRPGASCPSSHSPGPNNPGSDSFPSSEVIDFQGGPEPVQSSVLGGLWTSTPGKGNWSAQAGNHPQVACSPGPKRSLKKACGEGLSQHLNEWGWGPTQGSCLLWGRMRHTSAAHLPGSRGRRAPAGVGPAAGLS